MQLCVNAAPAYVYTGSRVLDPAQPYVVFVHGAAHDHSVWALQSRYFAYHGWNVLAVDLPGHGRSAGEPLRSIEAIADWIVACGEAAGAGAMAVVGHSMGSLAALECAARQPRRVTHLAMLGPAVPMEVSEVLMQAAMHDEPLAYRLVNGWSFGPAAQLGGNAVPGLWMTGNALRLMERSRPRVLATDLAACKAYLHGWQAGAEVRCPALVIVGERDLMAPPRSAAALIEALGNKRVVSLPGCGHSLMAEAPDAVLVALRTFLARA